jgi:hypothetical protein
MGGLNKSAGALGIFLQIHDLPFMVTARRGPDHEGARNPSKLRIVDHGLVIWRV